MLFLLLAGPFLGALLPAVAERISRGASAAVAALPPAIGLVLLALLAPQALSGDPISAQVAWIPSLGLELSLMLDGLGVLFSGMVLGIGLLVVIYANSYLGERDSPGRFFTYLLLFMGAMLGVVLSGNLLGTVVFWEMTSISSFLLIGFWNHTRDARRGARMALTVTGLGGLGLLGGSVLLTQLAGTSDLQELAQLGPQIGAHPLYLPALLLILLGAFTKSAQFPFHFWLPRAMAAPTPVSAYLHSATMVKAGVFLLARLHPALGGTDAWLWLVAGAGITTALVGGLLANLAHDLKGLLAYSTIGHLGIIVALLGIGTEGALIAASFHILNHALFKAALFMSAGIVDHEAGTRDLRKLGGLRRLMPITTVLALVVTAAMAGLPPLGGFISKEGFLEELLHLPMSGVWAAVGLLVSLLGVGYALRFAIGTFFGPQPESFPHTPHDPPIGMWGPVALLTAGALALGIAPHALASGFVERIAIAMSGGALHHHVHLALWHGLSPALAVSGGGVVLGAGLWWSLRRREPGLPIPDAEPLFHGGVAGLVRLARRVQDLAVQKKLSGSLSWVVITALALAAMPLVRGFSVGRLPSWTAMDIAVLSGSLLLCISAVAAVAFRRRRLVAVIAIGAVGSLVALGFVVFSAPDLAITQLSVEVATVILILLALDHFPRRAPPVSTTARRVRDVGLSVGVAVLAGALTWLLLTDPVVSETSAYYAAQSKPLGGGTNLVNVILVDFRGFDTFGEGMVLGIAALGVYAMIDGMGLRYPGSRPRPDDEGAHPMMLVVVARLLLPLAVTVAVYLFLRGHNHPGGGFVAGLVVAIALVLQVLASGFAWWQERTPASYHLLIAAGIAITTLSGITPWLFGRPFLTSWHDHFHLPVIGDLELASAAVFDLGIFLSVVGALLLVLVNLGRLPATPEVLTTHPKEGE